tara:strand:- start:228 stop:647 length:420 start_codon:yes stop_codon:yes gene_type:complete
MTKYLELMFYVAYLKVKKNGDGFLVASALIGLCVTGFFFVTSLLFLMGVIFDIGFMELMIYKTELGAPMLFIGPLVTLFIFYMVCLKDKSYLGYGDKYPEISMDNLDKYDQKYLLIPAVSSLVLFFVSVYLTFESGRGI